MPRNGSGTYTLPSGNPVVSGTTIEASWANNTLSDVGNELTNSLARTGAGGMTGALRLADGSAAVPGLAWSNETTTGLYRAGSGDMRLSILTADVQQWTALGSNITGAFDVSGNLTVGGTMTITGGINFNGNVTVGDSSADTLTVNATITSNLIFTDNTYDIGASGATRPRNLYLSNNLVTGGSIAVDSTTDSTSTTTGSIQTDGGLGVAKAAYIGTTLNVVGNTTLGDASTDTVTVNGYMGVGGAPNVAIGVFVRNTALTGVSPSAFSSAITLPATATSFPASYYSQPSLAASAFTVSDLAHFQAGNPSALSGGAAITNLHGLYINDQTRGTNNYGITSAVSSGTNKWNIYASGTAQNLFAGHLNLSSGVSTTQYINYGDGTTNYARLEGGKTGSGQGSLIFHTYLGGTLYERMRIDSSGNVGIGTSSTTRRFEVFGPSGSDCNLEFKTNKVDGQVQVLYTNDARTWITRINSSDQFQVRDNTAGADRLTIDSSGNVGIGTSNPTGGLHISDRGTDTGVTVDEFATYPSIWIRRAQGTQASPTTIANGQTLGYLHFAGYTGATYRVGANIYAAVTAGVSGDEIPTSLIFETTADGASSPTERMRIDSSGNVGIGTSSPGAKLDVSGAVRANVASYNQFIATRSSQSWVMGIDASNNWVVRDETGGDTKMYLSTSGNLGLGVAPSAWVTGYSGRVMQIGDAAAFGGSTNDSLSFMSANAFYDSVDSRWEYINTDYATLYEQLDSQHKWYTAPSGTAGDPITFTQAMTLDASGNLLVGTTSASISSSGLKYEGANGALLMVRDGNTPFAINRLTNDGNLIEFYQATSLEGTISVSGTTVSYNGGHLSRWSQTTDNTRIPLVKGTVMSNLDQMANWDGQANEQLNCMKVSDVEGDVNVAGVFVNWDNDDDEFTNDMNIAMTGDMIIRIAQGTVVQRGDLLMSAGDGTAKPQGDDIVRSKTVAKVTSTHITCTYDDGSYCVPCVLMAC